MTGKDAPVLDIFERLGCGQTVADRGVRSEPLIELRWGHRVESRHAAARENVAITDATMRFMVPPTSLHRLLRELLGDGFVALYLPVGTAGDPAGSADGVAFAQRALVDTEGVLAAAYGGPGSLCLIRPDGHVAARRHGTGGAELPDLVDIAAGAGLRSGQRVAAHGG